MVRPQALRLGLTPISWQGWVLTGVYVAAVFALAIFGAEMPQPWIFWTLLVLATVVYFLVAFLTRRM